MSESRPYTYLQEEGHSVYNIEKNLALQKLKSPFYRKALPFRQVLRGHTMFVPSEKGGARPGVHDQLSSVEDATSEETVGRCFTLLGGGDAVRGGIGSWERPVLLMPKVPLHQKRRTVGRLSFDFSFGQRESKAPFLEGRRRI